MTSMEEDQPDAGFDLEVLLCRLHRCIGAIAGCSTPGWGARSAAAASVV
jgi:hypothetical protein